MTSSSLKGLVLGFAAAAAMIAGTEASFLQPGERTAVLLNAFDAGLSDDVAAGASYDMWFGDLSNPLLVSLPLVPLPEPSASVPVALLALLALSGRARSPRPR